MGKWEVNGNADVWLDDEGCIYVFTEENANLIAAAPELLEALEEAVFWDSHDEGEVPAVWYEKAKAAIAKARGNEGGE